MRSTKSRKPAGPDRLAGVSELAAADAQLAFALYHQVAAAESASFFFSPYSISTALSMAFAGARGNTAAEIRSVLGVGEDEAAWHDARNRLELTLSSLEDRHLPREEWDEKGVPLTLEPTNAIFGQVGYAFRDAYLDILAANYGAGMQALDFARDPEAARLAINEWVADRTRDRIEELLAEGSIDEWTRAVLVNAIYLKASWYLDFDPAHTKSERFQLLDGSTAEVEMMHRSLTTGYASNNGWAAVRLPYWGSASMTVIVPDEGEFADVERKLDADFLSRVDESLSSHLVHLGLPRWESGSSLSLTPFLQELGVVDAFDQNAADLSGMADFSQTGERLYVADAVHQANITVDEEGTEAAAATALLIVPVCKCPPPEVTLTVDRPFIYVIRDALTGEILFVGRLLEPSGLA